MSRSAAAMASENANVACPARRASAAVSMRSAVSRSRVARIASSTKRVMTRRESS